VVIKVKPYIRFPDRFSSIRAVILAIVVYVIFWVLVGFWENHLEKLDPADWKNFTDSWSYFLIEEFVDISFLLLLLFLISKIYFKENLLLPRFSRSNLRKELLLTLKLGIPLIIVSEILYRISIKFLPLNWLAEEQFKIVNKANQVWEYIIIYSVIVVITPIIEEMFFRGFCYRILRKELSLFWSITIVTLIWLGFHPIAAWIPPLIVINLVLCLSFERTGSLNVPILIHALINFVNLTYHYLFGRGI